MNFFILPKKWKNIRGLYNIPEFFLRMLLPQVQISAIKLIKPSLFLKNQDWKD